MFLEQQESSRRDFATALERSYVDRVTFIRQSVSNHFRQKSDTREQTENAFFYGGSVVRECVR